MPTIPRPTPLDVFICIRSGINQVVEATPVVEYSVERPDQWTAIFPDNSRISWNTNRWKAFDVFHPADWVRTGAYYYPADCPERFPSAQEGESLKDYISRCKQMKLEGIEGFSNDQFSTIFTEKNGVLKKAEDKKEKAAAAKAANPKKEYPPIALPG